MTERYAVFGNPVEHSRSPDIHQAFAAEQGVDIVYERILAPEDGFAAALQQFFDDGGRGANVTLPFKGEAFRLCDQVTERARQAEAVNTLWRESDGLHGDNTDGAGLVRDLTINQGWRIEGQRVLIIGAGGAVQGILDPLLAHRPAEVIICNRTPEKAEQLAERFGHRGIPVYARALSEPGGGFDLVINAVSAGLSGEMPSLPDDLFSGRGCGYDMLYGAEPTPFLVWAEPRAVRAVDGLGMLVEQAAEAYFLWRHWRPATAAVIDRLRRSSP